jgi:hypothetical protein
VAAVEVVVVVAAEAVGDYTLLTTAHCCFVLQRAHFTHDVICR